VTAAEKHHPSRVVLFAFLAPIATTSPRATITGMGTYPRKLRGDIEAVYSTRLSEPTWHIDAHCPGLEAVPAEARGSAHFNGPIELGLVEDGRHCRKCSTERLLRSVLRPGRDDRRVYATFSGETPDRGPFPGWDPPTDSGLRRLRRIARHTGLDVVGDGRYTYAHGWVSLDGLLIASRNLRSYRLPARQNEDCLTLFWTLVRDEADPDERRVREILQTARLLGH